MQTSLTKDSPILCQFFNLFLEFLKTDGRGRERERGVSFPPSQLTKQSNEKLQL